MNQCPKTDCKGCKQCTPESVKRFNKAAAKATKHENKKLKD